MGRRRAASTWVTRSNILQLQADALCRLSSSQFRPLSTVLHRTQPVHLPRTMPSFARMPSIHIRPLTSIVIPLQNAISRLDFSLNPSLSLKRLRHYPLTWHGEGQYLFLGLLALFNLIIAVNPPLFGKLFIVAAYTTGVLVPLTSQFVLPATPIFSWLLLFWSSRWTQAAAHPHIWVSVLPTLESVLYGANISDILTRYTSSTLDILAWMPYGLFHFTFPFITAALIWIFGP